MAVRKKNEVNVFENVVDGLNQAIEYEKGKLKGVKTRRVTITPLPHYSGKKIKKIRSKTKLSQKIFANVLGVSVKTVEAWESGKNEPARPAQRILAFLDTDINFLEKYNIITDN